MAIKKILKERNSDGYLITTEYDRHGNIVHREDTERFTEDLNKLIDKPNYKLAYYTRKNSYGDIEKNCVLYLNDGKTFNIMGDDPENSFLVNDRGQLVYLKFPSGLEQVSSYDKDGNITSESDSNGYHCLYSYNEEGNLIAKDIKDGTGCTKHIDYFYDWNGSRYHLEQDPDDEEEVLLYKDNADGQRVSIKELCAGIKRIENIYDLYGKIMFHKDCGLTTEYFYNDFGDLEEERDSEGNWTIYEYEYWED